MRTILLHRGLLDIAAKLNALIFSNDENHSNFIHVLMFLCSLEAEGRSALGSCLRRR